ncbi:MAG TPA: 16S rRNA (guanine(527)-N(7))-methyltransferase RsmG [Rhizomicrobium sp.]|nr:16S rRNA (guanine(527)-N(7))-methyltransferase RsmG [Rhizomicrobium sp.]
MPLPEAFGPEDFARAANVSRETLARFEAFAALLSDWNSRQNLISRSSLADVWKRHIWDSAQLVPLIPANAKNLIDLGSGAGFPALVIATLRSDLRILLYEATAKKCRFLAEGAAALHVTVDIRNVRIEEAKREAFDVVTARACAPLDNLLAYASRFQGPKTVNLFLKGQNVEAELAEAAISWKMKVKTHLSQSDPTGRLLEIRALAHV